MRFFLPLLFLSFNSYAQLDVGSGALGNCSDTTFDTPATTQNIYECADVNITAPNFLGIDPAFPLIIKATGSVTIDNLDLSGADGSGQFGGAGSFGSGAGGDFLGSANPGAPSPQGGFTPTSTSTCSLAGDTAEGPGGGGGSLEVSGENGHTGTQVAGSGVLGPGGPAGSVVTIDINNFTFAGAGGGAGEVGCLNNAPTGSDPGPGGGGGGGIRVVAAGPISINNIDVSGGNGGAAVNIDGGGGGGSGGVIIIQTLDQITINGSLSAAPGLGGANSTASVTSGDGGDGAPGIIILQDLDGIVSGTFNPAPTIGTSSGGGSPIGSNSNLKSSINCGSIASVKNNDHNTFQVLVGFFAALIMSFLFRTLFRSRLKVS
jgi:hypothetical protein